MDKLIKLLEGVKPGVDFKKTTNLIDDGVLDSFDIVTIVSLINDEFDIDFPVSEVVPENFNSVEALYNTIKGLEDE